MIRGFSPRGKYLSDRPTTRTSNRINAPLAIIESTAAASLLVRAAAIIPCFMTPASQIAASSDLAVNSASHAIHAPAPGATATLINDLRELFKVKVVSLVVVTGWGGFYLGSMQSGISTL